MNLGDGLMFELVNGKPKLVLSHSGESKPSIKMGFCQVPQKGKALKATVSSKQHPKEAEKPQRDKKCRDQGDQGTSLITRKTKVKSRTDHGSVMVRGQSESKTKSTDDSSSATEKTVKENVVCLTQEQLEQIINNIKASGQNAPDTTVHIQNGGPTGDNCTSSEMLNSETSKLSLERQQCSQREENEKKLLDSTPAGLFSNLGERERGKEALKAKRAEWRRDLDEQMALKKQQKEKAQVLPQTEQFKGPSAGSRDQLLGVEEDRITRTSTANANNKQPSHQMHNNPKALPSAIRSAFVLGEAAPLEHAFTEEKKEEQRRWLQDLEQQREEAKMRKKKEKQSRNQAEDHERWAMHFDSFQRRLPVQPPPTLPIPGLDRGENEMGSSLSHHHYPSRPVSTAWDNMSAYGGDSISRASVDTTQGFQPRSSYLRTMTALLDPAQIEERERKRFKQLEHQRAIEAQVEERRRQKEKEEAARRASEQEEERRVARERELLQQQYMKDTQMRRQKEELHSRKTEKLYLSVQRAQEEAQKEKHLQRIKEMAKKGHDVTKLLRSLEGESVSQALSQESLSLATLEAAAGEVEVPHTSRKDTAVQTETEINAAIPGTGIQLPPNMKRSRRDAQPAERNTGKENICTATTEADPYEPFTRTDRSNGQKLCRKPQWNTQRPNKAFVPASERYPATLQRHRQESRMRRQMELMTLVERNTVSRTAQHCPSPPCLENQSHHRPMNSTHHRGVDLHQAPSTTTTHRIPSPPVPAVRHRLQQPPPPHTVKRAQSAGWLPSSDYIPYVRTDEVYHLDPCAPISRPTTHEAQQKSRADVNSNGHPTSLVQRDPLLHPELLKSTERQQAILKGLSELRQGLLQKQRELESSLSPLLQGQSRTQTPTYQPM
ncbi:coiled-coil domain-containing protein 66 isoform X2 [Trichomycterus rosablanca]|uniref:coiled-coil domain-containing protein 66 isoform X2 n=1 Tax=Trichomycterus rosablanca TaxID=2290929 RepID=UPI002F357A2B